MALVIEDGSLVDGANSYVTIEEARTYAGARASTLPVDDTALEALLVNAMDFLESFRDEYQGVKVSGDQDLQFPRKCVVIDGFPQLETSIPKILKNAQCQLACDQGTGLDLMPVGDGREVIFEKVDVIEQHYSPGSGGAPQPVLPRARALVAPLLKSASFSGGLQAVRI